MLLGPGSEGHIFDEAAAYSQLVEDGYFTETKINGIRRFCSEVQPGDFVVMRSGQRAIDVGVVPNADYSWSERFEDVHGWDLCHTRRVCWARIPPSELNDGDAERRIFGGQPSMFSEVHSHDAIQALGPWLEKCKERPLADLPNPPGEILSDEQIGELLFSHGLPQTSVESLLVAIERQRRLLRWYWEHGDASGRPTEHEIVAYMVLPMLLALGWSEQLLAIEWNKIDLAGFGQTPTTRESCVFVCEAKRLGAGLQKAAYRQAKGYVERLNLSSCQHVLLTQGQRFYLHRRRPDGEWPAEPVGYFNLGKLRSKYVVPEGTGAVETLLALTPQEILRDRGWKWNNC